MKKALFLPLILSGALLVTTPNKAKAYVPVAEIIIGIEAATAIAIAAKPLIKMTYKAMKKGTKKVIHFINRHRGNHNNRRDAFEEENRLGPSAPALLPANQDFDERFNTVSFTPPQTYGYSRRVVRYEEEMTYFGSAF